ncbi:MAG: M20/M25/M40 family metallo-hydrolase [Isosphaeraceae bacterium]
MQLATRRLAVVALLALAAIPAQAQQPESQKIISTARESSLVMDHLDFLVNRIGPRLTSSDNLQNACEWARDRFESYGLSNCRIEKWGEFPVGFNRGPWSGRVVEPESKPLTFCTNAWTAGTRGLTRGPAILEPENEDQLESLKGKLKGAWVLQAATPVRPGGQVSDFRKKLSDAYKEAEIAGLIRSSRSELVLTDGSYRINWDSLPTTPQVNLVKSQFDEIVGQLKEGKPVRLEFDIRNYFKKGPIPLYNVIADIPGTEKPDEYVIVGGHIDSWDGATGTTDNGTGCATTIEAARILIKSGVKPKRTIRFMLWSGEEQGLLGSAAYVKAHPELMPKISGVLVHDGGTNYLSGIGATKAQKEDMEKALAPCVGLDADMPFAIREVSGLRGGGSDHASFLAAGVPGYFWGQAGKAVYNHTHHTQHDTYDAAVPEYQKHSSLVAALASYGIANLDNLLSRENMTAPTGGGGGPGNRRLLGVQLDEMTVVDVIEGGPAEKAGIKAGDVLIKVDGKAIASREEMAAALQGAETTRKVVVKRDGKEVEVTVTFPGPAPR